MQKTRNGRRMDVEQSGRCGCGFLTRVDQAHDFLLLVGLEFGAAPTNAALLSRLIETAARAFAQHRGRHRKRKIKHQSALTCFIFRFL